MGAHAATADVCAPAAVKCPGFQRSYSVKQLEDWKERLVCMHPVIYSSHAPEAQRHMFSHLFPSSAQDPWNPGQFCSHSVYQALFSPSA